MNKNDEELMRQAMAEYEAEMLASQEAGTPQFKDADSQFKFMRELLTIEDTPRIGNMTGEELGKTNMSLRGALKVSLLSETIGLTETAKYYKSLGNMIAATSMSRKGTLLNLFFTQIRKTFSGSTNTDSPQKKGLFKWGNKNENDVQ